jgi:hypothetical protein
MMGSGYRPGVQVGCFNTEKQEQAYFKYVLNCKIAINVDDLVLLYICCTTK